MSVVHRFSVPTSLQLEDHQPRQSLGFWRLLGILYLVTCCGAYATEELVQAGGGPFLCLIGLLILPWIWGVPTALGVAELATAMPSNGGVLIWVNCTFHPSVTCTVAICTLFMNVIDNAIYPHLCADYFLQVIGDQDDWVAPVCKVVVTVVCCTLNVIGVGAVGDTSAVFMILCIAPFTIMFAFGIPLLQPVHWLEHAPQAEVDWGRVISMLTWNLSGFDAAGHIAEEIKNPTTNFPRAVISCLIVTTITYILPILIGTSVDQNYSEWEDGYWSIIAGKVSGQWLQIVMGVGGCCSGFGLLLSYLCTTSRATGSTAVMGIYPNAVNRQLGILSASGIPRRAILFMSFLTLTFSLILDFSELVAVSSFFYAARLFLILLALPILRFRYPSLPRPYKLPCGAWGVVAIVAFPVLFCLLNLVACAYLNLRTLALGPVFMVTALGLSWLYVRCFKPEGFQGVIVAQPSVGESPQSSSDGTLGPDTQGGSTEPEIQLLSTFDGIQDAKTEDGTRNLLPSGVPISTDV